MRALRARLDAMMKQRVTPLGLAFTAAILLVAAASFASANNLLFLLLAVMLSTLLISGFVSRLSLAGLEMEFLPPEHISARRKVTGRLVLRNGKTWMPSFSIRLAGSPGSGFVSEIYFPVIPGGAALEENVEVYFARRGAHRGGTFRFSTRFPFGFTERSVEVDLRRDVLVYPCLDAQADFERLLSSIAGEIETHYRGRGHDFYRIRPYVPLESARHVDWRATAHTGELQVREFAREQEHLVYIFLDLDAHDRDAAWFERAVDFAAFLAWRLAQRGARLRFRTQDFDLRVPEEGDVYTVLKYLALVAPAPGKAPVPAGGDSGFQVVLSAHPGRLAGYGWIPGRLLSADDLPAAAADYNPASNS